MTTQHTAEHWEICQNWQEERSKKIQPQGCDIGVAIAYGDTEEEATANARLIAAAPELLSALEKIADYVFGMESELNICSSVWMDARAAIAKATQP